VAYPLQRPRRKRSEDLDVVTVSAEDVLRLLEACADWQKFLCDKVIWEGVKRVAVRAGVRCHVHALRAAFAVQFDEAHPDQVIALKELMGRRIETTLVYLRRKDKAKAMESVRDLSWGVSGFSSQAQEAHTGFEPVPPP
jgi:hypothetical protein